MNSSAHHLGHHSQQDACKLFPLACPVATIARGMFVHIMYSNLCYAHAELLRDRVLNDCCCTYHLIETEVKVQYVLSWPDLTTSNQFRCPYYASNWIEEEEILDWEGLYRLPSQTDQSRHLSGI